MSIDTIAICVAVAVFLFLWLLHPIQFYARRRPKLDTLSALPVVEGDDWRGRVPFIVQVQRTSATNAVLQVFVNGELRGTAPIDNVVKMAIRVAPEYAKGPELQIQLLKRELAKAHAELVQLKYKAS